MSEQMQSANSFCQMTIAILHNRVSDHCCSHSRLNIFAEQMFYTRYFQWSFMRSRGRVSLIHSRRSKVPPLPWSWSALQVEHIGFRGLPRNLLVVQTIKGPQRCRPYLGHKVRWILIFPKVQALTLRELSIMLIVFWRIWNNFILSLIWDHSFKQGLLCKYTAHNL